MEKKKVLPQLFFSDLETRRLETHEIYSVLNVHAVSYADLFIFLTQNECKCDVLFYWDLLSFYGISVNNLNEFKKGW